MNDVDVFRIDAQAGQVVMLNAGAVVPEGSAEHAPTLTLTNSGGAAKQRAAVHRCHQRRLLYARGAAGARRLHPDRHPGRGGRLRRHPRHQRRRGDDAACVRPDGPRAQALAAHLAYVAEASGVGLHATLSFTFSEAVSAAGLALTDESGATVALATPLVSGATVTLDPLAFLLPGTTYSVSLAGVKDLAGNGYAAPAPFTFKTTPASSAPSAGNGAGAMASGVTRAQVLEQFSESQENQYALAGVIGEGFTYIPLP